MSTSPQAAPTSGIVALRAATASHTDRVDSSKSAQAQNDFDRFQELKPGPFGRPLRVGSWILESLIGEGMLTQVYVARPADARSNTPARYAIKILRDRWHDNPVALARVRAEAMVGRCVAHRNVVSILTAHVHRPPHHLVMPLLPAPNVAILLTRRVHPG